MLAELRTKLSEREAALRQAGERSASLQVQLEQARKEFEAEKAAAEKELARLREALKKAEKLGKDQGTTHAEELEILKVKLKEQLDSILSKEQEIKRLKEGLQEITNKSASSQDRVREELTKREAEVAKLTGMNKSLTDKVSHRKTQYGGGR